MISNLIIYKFFKDITNHRKNTNRAVVFSSIDLSPTFLNTGTTNETFQQSGKQYSVRHILKSSAGMYESSGSQFFRSTTGIQQKLPPRGVLKKRCSDHMQQIYRRTLMQKCNFNKVAKHLHWNRTLGWVFSCKFTELLFLGTPLGVCFWYNQDQTLLTNGCYGNIMKFQISSRRENR